MIFGDPQLFAAEAILEPGPEYGPVSGNNIAGRIRIWMSGQAIGNFDNPHCWLGPPHQHLAEMVRSCDELWHISFNSLSTEAIFDRLNLLVFAANRDGSVSNECEGEKSDFFGMEEKTFDRFMFLLHSSEAFDGWKAFLVHPPGSELLALVFPIKSPVVTAYRFPVDVFRQAVHDLGEWIEMEEQRLLPHLALRKQESLENDREPKANGD